ncbi:MAG TPA: enoyl-CoA hydratase-related protein [Rhizomicrobium sp.]|nr:enoyl-CoA hydratase-related protein [Rhizomicrobium sp.]
MRTDFERCYVTSRGGVAVLTLNHPETVNAASFSMMQGCLKAMDLIEADPAFRALVFTGEGRGFCSGANLSEPPSKSADLGDTLERTYHPFLRRLRDTRLPIVTALNGPAAGVGVSLALMGDLVIAARSAFLAVGFTRLGLVPDGGSTWLLPRLVGLARARELALLGERLPADKAQDWGLIHKVVDDEMVLDSALALASRLAEGPKAIAFTRKLFWESTHLSFEDQLKREQAAQAKAGATEDFREGVMAFFEKREPRFKGK